MESKINIPMILETEEASTKKIGRILKQYHFTKVACYMGKGLYHLFGKEIVDGFSNTEGIDMIVSEEYESLDIEAITKKAFSIPKNVDCIIGIGGGKAIDCAKYMAFITKRPFISVPTSISNDGFSSSNCSLLVDGKRTSVSTAMPFGIIADLAILKSAPKRFYYSGIGDIVSKITAVYDWEHEDQLTPGALNHFAAMMSKKSVNSVVRLPFTYINEPLFIKEVVDSLIMSGIAMEIAGHSAPASGSEHQISHALDVILETPVLHGIQVGIATYLMSLLQEHRSDRIKQFLTDTGFFDHAATTGLTKNDFTKAIALAPSIKPNRSTFINDPAIQEKANAILHTDSILNRILF